MHLSALLMTLGALATTLGALAQQVKGAQEQEFSLSLPWLEDLINPVSVLNTYFFLLKCIRFYGVHKL